MQETATKELTVLKTQVSKLENEVNSVIITNAEEYAVAVDIVSRIKKTGSAIKEKKEGITKPLNEALKNARNLFAPIELQFMNAESIIKRKLLDYKRKIDEEARLREEAIAKKVEAGRMRVDTAERKMGEIERVDTTTRGRVGEVQIRKVRKVRIVDVTLLPMEYMIPDETAIRRDALAGKHIPGTEIYEEEHIAAR